jgi:putative transposase
VDLAFKAFFRRVKAGEKPGFPRFKGQGRYRSFTYKQFGFKLTDEGQLGLSKMGDVKMVMHRPIQGQIKTLTICRYATGKWYACFSVEVEPEPLPATDQVVGIDVGLEQFATFSNGEVIDNPRFLRQEEKALAKTQRRLSQLEKGSPEYLKQKKRLSRIHERIQFQRDDFAHQHSRRIVEAFQVIAFEDLDIQAMLENASNGLAKSIADAAWRQLVQDTCYKAESAGRTVILVDPRGTSQRCSGCGSVVEKSLSERTHHCHTCGLMLDRDLNAARNILALGLQGIGSNP